MDTQHLIQNAWTIIKSPVYWLPIVFRVMAWLTAAPILFATLLDVAAYVIARTVGQIPPKGSTFPIIQVSDASQKDAAISSITSQPDHPPTVQVETNGDAKTPTHFTSASEPAVAALSGEGVFSPPISRAASPTLDRKSRSRSGSQTAETAAAKDDSTPQEVRRRKGIATFSPIDT